MEEIYIDNVTNGLIEADYLSDTSNNTLELIDSNSYKIQFHKNGDRGSRGYQGLIGMQGYQGTPGSFGGASFDYTFNGSGIRTSFCW